MRRSAWPRYAATSSSISRIWSLSDLIFWSASPSARSRACRLSARLLERSISVVRSSSSSMVLASNLPQAPAHSVRSCANLSLRSSMRRSASLRYTAVPASISAMRSLNDFALCSVWASALSRAARISSSLLVRSISEARACSNSFLLPSNASRAVAKPVRSR